MQFTHRIKTFFESFAAYIYSHPWRTITIVIVLSLGLMSQLPKLKIDTSPEGFFHETDPVLINYKEFQEQFGRDDMIIVAMKPPEVFNFGFLKKLKVIHEEIEDSVPYIADVKSLINARSTLGKDDELIVDNLLENWPKNISELEAIKQRALTNPVYKNTLISEDGRFTTITIKINQYSMLNIDAGDSSDSYDNDPFSGFEDVNEAELLFEKVKGKHVVNKRAVITDQEKTEIIEKLSAIIEKQRGPKFHIYLSGSPVMDMAIKVNLRKDINKFMVISILVIVIFLFILFRRVSGVFLPLFVVTISLLATFGLMSICGVALKVPTQILPSFLLAVGIGDSVHVLVIFYRRLRENNDKKNVIVSSLSHSGRAITLTSLTTAGGLCSFISSDLAPVVDSCNILWHSGTL